MSKPVTLECTASFVHIWEPHAAVEGGDKKYSIQMVFDPGYDYSLVNQHINEAIAEKWGNIPPPGLRMPLVDPLTKPNLAMKPFYQGGKFYISATSSDPVPVYDMSNTKIINPAELFSGCRVLARVSFAAFTQGGAGVGCFLNGVQIIRNDDSVERLDNRESVEEMFGAAQPVTGTAGLPVTGAPIAQQQMPQQGMPQQAVPNAQPGAQMQQPVAGQPVPGAAAPVGQTAGVQPAVGYPSNPAVMPGPAIDPLTGLPYPVQ